MKVWSLNGQWNFIDREDVVCWFVPDGETCQGVKTGQKAIGPSNVTMTFMNRAPGEKSTITELNGRRSTYVIKWPDGEGEIERKRRVRKPTLTSA
jgi:hypothetical protein